MSRVITFGNLPTAPAPAADETTPDWVQANPARIERALTRALALPTGGWFAVDASEKIGRAPTVYTIDGRALVLWRAADGSLRAGPEACPHMGASLACAKVRGDELVCPWHGLHLGERTHGRWQLLKVHDDGVLAWVRLGSEAPTESPVLAPRPGRFVAGVIRMEARCDPEDILANRLDPWHGVHYHPHSFMRLRVLEASDELLRLRVAYRVVGPLAVEVDATFHCPDARTIVMTIVDGEGTGSLVETHATPISPGRTAVIEATLATSDRPGFGVALKMGRWLRPAINRRAARLWVEDVAYAERRYQLRASAPVRLRTVPNQ